MKAWAACCPTGSVTASLNRISSSTRLWTEPSNSIVLLNENLAARGPGNPADTGADYLLFAYLQQRLGEGMTEAVLNAAECGTAGLDEALASHEYDGRFLKLYNDWAVSLAINTRKPANKYYFEGLNRTAAFTDGIPSLLNPWTPVLWWLDPEPRITGIVANGTDYLSSPWTTADGPVQPGNPALYSGGADLSDLGMYTAVDLTAASGGRPQFPKLLEHRSHLGLRVCSGVYGQRGYLDQSFQRKHFLHPSPEGLSGHHRQPAWIHRLFGWMEHQVFDLGPYCSQRILLGFRYMTDWGTLGQTSSKPKNWYVDDILIESAGIQNDGAVLAPFGTLAMAKGDPLDYLVGFAGEKKGAPYKVGAANLLEFRSDGGETIEEFLHDHSLKRILMIVSFAADDGINEPVPIDLEIIRTTLPNPK